MGFGGDENSNDGIMSDINMTPLVDVMLVLLIIFIITVPVLTHSVQVDLPQEQNQPNRIEPKTITISVTANGTYYWGDSEINTSELENRLTAAAKNEPQPEVHIRGDKKTDYEHVMKAMSLSQKAGIVKLGFLTDPV